MRAFARLLPMTRFIVALVIGLVAGPALPQHKHSHPLKSQHGGEVVEGRRHHFELVLAPAAEAGVTEVALYVTDHRNRPSKFDSASAEASIRSKGASTTVSLAAAGPSVLKGVGRFAADPAMEVQVTVTLGKLPAEKLVFRPLAPSR